MKANFRFAEKYAETLLKDPTLPDSTRQKLSNAYQTALETKDFFCNGTDCNSTSKDGKGPNLIEELITPLCEQNKAKLLALNEALKSASNTASSLYDYTQQYTTSIDLTVLETNTDKGKLKTNECGEYLMLLETSSVGSPSLGIPPSSVLVAPKGKQAASSQFTEVELYQYILLREMYSSVVDCKTIALSSNYYIDGKYNEALYFVRSFLQEKSYMGASPSVNAQIRDRLIRGLLESTSPDLAVSAIKKYANLNAYFNASSVLEFAKSYAVAEVGGKIVLGTLGRIAKHPLIKNAVGKILSKFTTGAGDALLNAFKSGFSKESILAIPKGSRPLPSTYLKEEYITTHLAKFENGASYLVPQSALDNYGRALIGRPDGQFVMSKFDMDNLLAKANGDLTVIETELGIPAGLWKNKQLVRIDIPNPKKLEIRIPSGNEGGANELWLPGGKLPNGYSEAVVNQIPKGKYIEILTNIK